MGSRAGRRPAWRVAGMRMLRRLMSAARRAAAGPRYHIGLRSPDPFPPPCPPRIPPSSTTLWPPRRPPGEALTIAPGIAWLRMPLPFALDHINLWLLEDGDGLDAGRHAAIGDATTRALWERHFADDPARQARSSASIATHCHPDHLGNAAWLAERFGCRGDDDARRVPGRARDHSTSARRTARSTPARCSGCHGMAGGGRRRARGARQSLPARRARAPPRRSSACIDGDDVVVGGERWRVDRRATATRPSTRRCSRRRTTC